LTSNNLKSLKDISSNEIKPKIIWHLYIVQTRFGHWYTGITTNVEKRLATHEAGKGAKNLKGKGPLSLIHHQEVGSKSEASKLEYQIKQLSRVKKQKYVDSFKSLD
jgi:putative endonuclease